MRPPLLHAAAGLLACGIPATAAAQAAAPAQAIVALPDAVTWMSAPPILPPGATVAILEGDPAKPGPFTMRLRMPDGYRIAPHFHAALEHVTVLSGSFLVGMGGKWDAAALKSLPVGSFGVIPPGMQHFAQARGETVIQLHGIGPWGLTYVNPADAPGQAGGSR
ncbi:MAG TPA: cupin domain-containing protein [Gemmatimonadales bacterium]|nr:cupin domain-containing protein [Gemmatimonadales bacterium]